MAVSIYTREREKRAERERVRKKVLVNGLSENPIIVWLFSEWMCFSFPKADAWHRP